jgi:hypothetical protein
MRAFSCVASDAEVVGPCSNPHAAIPGDPIQALLDALHRQINILVRNGKTMRKKRLTAREGSRRASASHATHSAVPTGTAGRSVPVPTEGPVQKARIAEELCVPSAAQESSAPQHRRGRVGVRALRRSICARWTRSMPEVSLRVWRHTCTHDSLTHHAAWTACKAHVLAGAGSAVQHLQSRKL